MPTWSAIPANWKPQSKPSKRWTLGLGRIYQALKPRGGSWIITADHGNAETMIDPATGGPHTYHTTNPVPFICVSDNDQLQLAPGGALRGHRADNVGNIGRARAQGHDRPRFAVNREALTTSPSWWFERTQNKTAFHSIHERHKINPCQPEKRLCDEGSQLKIHFASTIENLKLQGATTTSTDNQSPTPPLGAVYPSFAYTTHFCFLPF